MRIVITGTPGTGKTTVARDLGKILGYPVISLTKLATGKKIPTHYDRQRKSLIVDETRLARHMDKILSTYPNCIIESHLAQFIPADLCVVLRTNPLVLEKRLRKRRWSRRKIIENIHAEILDLNAAEALQHQKQVIELDTSGKTAAQTAQRIAMILKRHIQKKYCAGTIDWTQRYAHYLTR